MDIMINISIQGRKQTGDPVTWSSGFFLISLNSCSPHIAWYWNFTAKRSIVIKYSTSLRLSCREGLLCEIRVERDRQAIVTLISLCSRLSTALKESMNELALTRLVTR